MSKCAIYEVDFTAKQLTNKFLGSEKVEYYRCISCQNKYSKTKSDVSFTPSVSWSIEQGKRTIDYTLCKHCVDSMTKLLNGG